MVQTTASFATHDSDPPVIPRKNDQIHYVPLVRTSNFEQTTINQREIEFLVGHGACNDDESPVFIIKKTGYCKHHNSIMCSDVNLVCCHMVLADGGLQGPKTPPL